MKNYRQLAASQLVKEASWIKSLKFGLSSNSRTVNAVAEEAKKKTFFGRTKSALGAASGVVVPVVATAGIGGTIMATSALTNRSFGESV